MSAPAKIILVVFLVVFFLVIGMIVAGIVAMPLFGYDMNALSRIIGNPNAENLFIVKYFQIVQSVLVFMVPAILAAYFFSEKTMHYLKADRKVTMYGTLLVLLSLIVAIPMMNAITSLNAMLELPRWMSGLEMRIRSLEDNAAALTELFLKGSTLGDLVVNFIMIAILPAIGEEFLFRGVIQRLFAEWTKSVHWGVVIAAFLFSFIHFQFYGFVPRFLLGLYFGYLLVWSSSIWLPVLGHLVNNGIAVVVYHFAKQPAGSTTLDTLGTPESGFYTLYISVFLTCGLIGLIYLHTRQKAAS